MRVSPHSQPLARPRSPFPPNAEQKKRRRKVGFTPRLFFCLSKDLLFIVCDTESLCLPPRGACGGGFFLGAAGGTCDSSERMSPARVTLWRPAEDTEMLQRFLRLHLIELVIIAREQNVTEAVFQNLRPPLAAVTGVLLPGTNQQWSLVPQ